MSAGGITLEEGVMIGPDVSLLTVNHDKEDLQVIICKPIVIKKVHGLMQNQLLCQVLP